MKGRIPGVPSWVPRLAEAWLRIALGLIFVWAAITKLQDGATFAEDIAAYRLVPQALIPWVAALLPGIELVAGAALIVGLFSRGAALLTGCLMAIFLLALVQALARGIDLRCGCFGGETVADWTTVIRDLSLIGVCCIVARSRGGKVDDGKARGGSLV